MIIDMHTHTFPDKMAVDVIDKLSHASRAIAFTDGTIGALSKSMDEANVNLSVILPVATNTRQVEKVNNVAANINEKFADSGLISFGCMYPDYDNYSSELSRIKSIGFKGIKVHPIYQGTDLDDIKYLRIFERAAELDLIIVTHAGLDIGFPGVIHSSPQMARHVVDEIGDFKFVLAHMGGWKNWDEVPEYLADTKVYIDTAFSAGFIPARSDYTWKPEDLTLMSQEKFVDFIKIFGADRVIFGTDSPWSSQIESVKFMENLPISDDDKKKILGENSAKLLNIK